jgi:hypothetical protein
LEKIILDLSSGKLISSFHDKGNSQPTIEHFKKVRKNYDKEIHLAFLIDNAPWHKTKVVQGYCRDNILHYCFYLHIHRNLIQ